MTDLNRIVQVYNRIRDAKALHIQQSDAKTAEYDEQLAKLDGYLLGVMNTTKQESFRTESGTVYRQEDVLPAGSDWGAFYKWIAENDAFEFLERRIKKTAVAEYREKNKGALPPGVSVTRRYVVRVRKN